MSKDILEVPGVKPGQVTPRPGWEFTIPGECLKPGSALWTPEQRERGVLARCVFLTAVEEEAVLNEVKGNAMAIFVCQVRKSLALIDGKVVPVLERAAIWEELGPQGRGLVADAYRKANATSEEAVQEFSASFRLVG